MAGAIVAAVSLHDDYVAAAYLVLFALVLVYVAIMAAKLGRLERELAELNELAEAARDSEPVGAGGSAS
jgi:CcmD family protein